MQRGKKNSNVMIGAFIFLGIFLFLFFIYFAGKFSFILGGGYQLNIEYDFLDNLQVGAKVKVSGGPPIGYISKINFERGKLVVITMIEGKYKINRGANFNIYSTSLVGQKYINVSGYIPDQKDNYTNYETITGITPIGFARTIELAGAGVQNLLGTSNTDMVSKLKGVFENTVELIEGLNHVIKDNSKDVHQSVVELEESTRKLSKALDSLDERQLKSIMSNIDSVTVELKNLSVDLNRLTYDKNSPLNLARDKEFRARIENTMKNMEEFSKKINDNPSRLLFGK